MSESDLALFEFDTFLQLGRCRWIVWLLDSDFFFFFNLFGKFNIVCSPTVNGDLM